MKITQSDPCRKPFFLLFLRFLISFCLLLPGVLVAQTLNLPMLPGFGDHRLEKKLDSSGSEFHTSFKPYTQYELLKALPDAGAQDSLDAGLYTPHASALSSLHVMPLLQLEGQGAHYWNSSAGLGVSDQVTKDLSVYADFQYGKAHLLPYQQAYVNKYGIYPGWGRVMRINPGENTFEYKSWNAYVSYRPWEMIGIQAGQGKNFIGDGYRSLLLSDNTASYPYLRLNASFAKVQYVVLLTELENLPVIGGVVSPRSKFGAFHYLDININKHLSIGLFEAVIWQGQDSIGTQRGFDVNYLNPLILYRPVEYSRQSPDNSLIGVTAKYKLGVNTRFYGQFILDDFNAEMTSKGSGYFQDKYGFQLGAKVYDLFKVKNLFLLAEFNAVRPYTFAHKAPLQNYSSENQALAHPLGANFREAVLMLSYRHKRFLLSSKLTYAQYGADEGSLSKGQDLFRSDYDAPLYSFGNHIGQGILTDLINTDVRLYCRLQDNINLNAYIGWMGRWQQSAAGNSHEDYILIGLKTALYNQYWDF